MKRYPCLSCDRDLPSNQFPKMPPAPACTHDRKTCRRCWRQWLHVQVNTKPADQISCAQCSTMLGQSDIRALATPATYEKFLDSGLKAALSIDPDFRWCIASGCNSGQLHVQGNIFQCVQCGHKACVSCNVEWHEEESCEAFQARRKAQPQQEMQSAEKLKKCSKMCPKCDRKIQKDGGCDHIRCTMCGYQFCWRCLADYKHILATGNHGHDKSCRHWREPGSTEHPAYGFR